MTLPYLKIFSVLVISILLFNNPLAAQEQQGIYHETWIDFNKNGKMDPYEDPSLSIDRRVNDLVKRMNINEKASQLTTLYGSNAVLKDPLPTEDWKNEVWGHGIANIDEHLTGLRNDMEYALPFSKHIKSRDSVQRFFVEQTRLGIPVDFTNEALAGVQHAEATAFPREIALGSTFNKDLIHQIGIIEGQEAKALGYTNIYSPEIDVSSDPRWGRVLSTYSSSPFLTGVFGTEMVKGIQSQGIASTLKHFAVYSIPIGGRDGGVRTHPQVAPREMREIHLAPFRKTITEAHPMGVMASYNEYDGVPIIASKKFLTDILRTTYGFDGYVVSDSEAVEYVWNKHHVAQDYQDAIKQVLEAGLNVRTNFTEPEEYIKPLISAIKNKKVADSTVNKRVAEVLKVKFKLGLFDQPYIKDTLPASKIVHNAAAQKTAVRAAHQSIVLLKNDTLESTHSPILPLDPKSLKTLAIIGPNAKEKKSLHTRYGPPKFEVKSIYEGIKEDLPEHVNLRFAKGVEHTDPHWPKSDIISFPLDKTEKKSISKAVKIAKKADAVILAVGDNDKTVGEFYSRLSLDLPGHQKELVKAIAATKTPTVMILSNGRPVSINWADEHIPGIIESWYLGEASGQAISDVLFGRYNPGGKLSIPFPKSAGQAPLSFPMKPADEASGQAREEGLLYPFGHGLSYTKFVYKDLTLPSPQAHQGEKIEISFSITNTGHTEGDAVPQLYLHQETSSVTTYVKKLRGFKRVTLAPGETKQINMSLSPEDLKIWDRNMNFTAEPGSYKVLIGKSAEDIVLKKSFELVPQ